MGYFNSCFHFYVLCALVSICCIVYLPGVKYVMKDLVAKEMFFFFCSRVMILDLESGFYLPN